MTTPSKAAREKALEMSNGIFAERGSDRTPYMERDFGEGGYAALIALARYIDEVSEKANYVAREFPDNPSWNKCRAALKPLILPDEPDPLAHALQGSVVDPEDFARRLRSRLASNGLKIVEANGDD